MVAFIDRARGIYHFAADRAPRDAPLVEPRPRFANPWQRGGQALVSRVAVSEDVKASVERAIALLGDLGQAVARGERVLVKPNFNSPDPSPGSTDLAFLGAVVELLKEAGAQVTIGESSGGIWRPTRNVYAQVGLPELARRLDVGLVAFEDRPDDWVRVRVDGDYLDTVTMPRSAYEADRLVYLPCMKTHSLARFTGALKLAVGFMHPGERRSLHASHLEHKAAELSLCWQPHLIVMDGRKAFVRGGPDRGQLVEPGLVLASGDLIAIDVEAMKVIASYGARNRLHADPWQSPQVQQALKHGLGSRPGEYIVVQ